MSIVPSGRVDRRDRLGVADRAARLGERAARRPRGRPRPRRGTGRRRRSRRRRRPSTPARASRAPWPPPGGPRRRVTSGRCPSRRAGASRTSTIAFDVTPRTSRQARSRSSCSSVGRRAAGRAGPGRRVVGADVRRGDEHRAAGGPDRAGRLGGVGRDGSSEASSLVDQHPQVRLRREDLERLGVEGGRDDDLEEDRGQAPRRPARSTSRVSATTPPNALTGSASRAAVPGVEERRPLGRAARVGVLDDDDARPAQRPPERRRGGRVEHVVVGQRLALERRAARRRTGRRRASTPVAGSGRPAGAGSRRSAASRPSRGRWSATPGTGRPGGVEQARRRPAGRAARRRSARRTRRCGRTPRAPARAGAVVEPAVGVERRRARRRSGPATSRSRRWRGSWPPPGPSTARRCRSPRSARRS